MGTAMLAGMGLGIGAIGDWAVRGKTVVYLAPSGRVTVLPVLLRRDNGVGMAVRF